MFSSGTHTGAAYSPMPGLTPIDKTDTCVKIGPETFTLWVDAAGKVCKTEITPLGAGHPHGPPGFYLGIGGTLPPPPSTDVEPEVLDMLSKFCKFDAEATQYADKDCMLNPPGAPPMPFEAVNGMMAAMKGPWPAWESKFHGASKNPDGTYAVLTQQCPGPMKGDFPAMGPFPFIAFDPLPDIVKTEDLKNPIEVGTFTLTADKTKVVKAAYEIDSHKGHSKVGGGSPSVTEVWGKKGDGSDVGFGAYFALMGVEMPAPPAP